MSEPEFLGPITILILVFVLAAYAIYKEESRWTVLEYKTPSYACNMEYTTLSTDEIETVVTNIHRDMLNKLKK